MFTAIKHILLETFIILVVSTVVVAQSSSSSGTTKKPSKSIRPVVVLSSQSLADVEKKLGTENKTEDLIGGPGMQLRVAVQHEKNKAAGLAEVHDASDDVYYVTDGSATLILGGTLEAPREVEPGEWRGPRIIDGKSFEVTKGSLIVVPRGTPHQRSTVDKDFTMILIKVFAEPRPAPQSK